MIMHFPIRVTSAIVISITSDKTGDGISQNETHGVAFFVNFILVKEFGKL